MTSELSNVPLLSSCGTPVLAPPVGTWAGRKPSFGRTVRALFKREFTVKLRHYPSILEFLAACFIAVLLYPIWKLARTTIEGSVNPVYDYTGMNFTDEIAFFFTSDVVRLVFLPDCEVVQGFRDLVKISVASYGLPDGKVNYSVVNTIAEMKEIIYSSDQNGVGINWVNAKEEDWALNPEIQLYKQTLMGDPENLLLALGLGFVQMAGPVAVDFVPSQEYAQYTHDDLFDIQIMVAFFAVVPIILATMPGVQSILDDKDTHVTTLILLMGCTETEYWLVQAVMLIFASIVPYIILGIMLCFMFGMVGTSFTLFMFEAFLFCVAHSFFLLMITTFMKHGVAGRAMTVAFGLLVIFFGYLHYFYTLNENNTSEILKHALSVLPLSAYQLLVLMMFSRVKNGFGGIGWADIMKDMIYPQWYGILWLVIDSVVFFLLWMLFNATNSKDFGLQLIRWRDFFTIKAWQFLFKSRDHFEMQTIQATSNALEVDGLTKVFKGKKPITAVDNVSFSIQPGEVIVMIGPNGAGKSTLINTVAGAIMKDEGTMRLFGNAPTERFQDIHQYLGICFQENVLIDLLNVKEHFELFGAFRGIPSEHLKSAIDFFASTLQLTESLNSRSIDLSGGQKRKLCLALALLGNPPLLIMDEPTAGVDVQARQLIWKTVSSLKTSTCLITSHALEEAEAVSSRLFIVANGRVPFRGTSTELRKEFKCGYILRVEREDGTVGGVLDLARKYCPDAHVTEERHDSITMQVNSRVPEMLQDLTERQSELGVISYSFAVEQLEDTLLRMIETAEAAFEGQKK